MEKLSGIDPRIWKYSGIPYNKQMGPDLVPDLETAKRLGANCAAFAHLYNEEIHGRPLPAHLGPLEMWLDNKILIEVGRNDLTFGDLAFFGRNSIDPRPVPQHLENDPEESAKFMRKHQVPHIACIAGQEPQSGELLLAHLSFTERGFSIWPEGKFYTHISTFGVPIYERLHGIKRPSEILYQKGNSS
ncbi:hypothetical protein A3B45_01630 [Candidatus Daviesbacteria bacterium RIFCSPLOWO2_01_FULL_39_12]|uniref:Uncharacterized protein n=1 Tax=Candidatus Daviesbacteria bacterium RIFCSPLOWO2_01_FULL_39_12 TaxID=1797785 RepID=A0A1F5KPE0_9BACT|nr:MAG: hypothetical protein A3D79_02800 [Candidatus Daviesbacteria bacterium RIFCSPHIGHO2_02_FULL_39_8]OGE42481.1 MAG: hypothetical protein A3B45_01630 [Candidatus Daviesbacteria bacterium RIFCSPLOWO2_01_FULL_39_12]